MIRLKKGLDLPIEGEPKQEVSEGTKVSHVAVIGDDLIGMKPTMLVKAGDKVEAGQVLFTDKKTEGVKYTAPASGEVVAVNRGAKRAFESVVIKVEGDNHVAFESYKGASVSDYDSEAMKSLLIESGMWTTIRRRPFSKVANPSETPSSIFVTAIDTHPLSADPQVVLKGKEAAFKKGLEVLAKLSSNVHLCVAPKSSITDEGVQAVKRHEFDGPHPAGLVGTHIHFIDPVGEKKLVWHIGYQDVVAIGKLLETGKLFTERVIAIAGPAARNPRLVKTQVGACISELTKEEIHDVKEVRRVSGSVFGGRKAAGGFDYLGRFHNQITLLEEGRDREFLGWHSPGFNKFSIKPIYISKLLSKKFAFDTNTHGSLRSIVPIGSYEKVMPLDIYPTFLLRALMSGNTEKSIELGILELDEEDISLCTFVDPCKNDFAPKLRANLDKIEKEG